MLLKKQIGRMSSGRDFGAGNWKLSITGMMLHPPSSAATTSWNNVISYERIF